tara:strand:+ start:2629 stop:2817 length:189 start_codon:yes stop_codon:yes gene_type:complete
VYIDSQFPLDDDKVADRVIDALVDQRYHWSALTPSDSMKMAVELQQYREAHKKLNNKMGDIK